MNTARCIPLCFQIINATAQKKCTNLQLIGPFCRMFWACFLKRDTKHSYWIDKNIIYLLVLHELSFFFPPLRYCTYTKKCQNNFQGFAKPKKIRSCVCRTLFQLLVQNDVIFNYLLSVDLSLKTFLPWGLWLFSADSGKGNPSVLLSSTASSLRTLVFLCFDVVTCQHILFAPVFLWA